MMLIAEEFWLEQEVIIEREKHQQKDFWEITRKINIIKV